MGSNGCAAKLERLATSSVWLMLLLMSLLLAKLLRMLLLLLLLLAASANGPARLALHCCRESPRPDTMLSVCEAS
jgi:hypothetical protein